MNILNDIKQAYKVNQKLLAILVDPDDVFDTVKLCEDISVFPPDLILVGGSTIEKNNFHEVVSVLKNLNVAPVVLFPGDVSQISETADAILLLSLISGNNPEYLIGQHIKAAPILKKWGKEIIPTSYILIDGGRETSVQRVSQTVPIAQNDIEIIMNTALAGSQMGHQLVYLEAGSGAKNHVEVAIISNLYKELNIPLIVGGGIRNTQTAKMLWDAGATVLVVGTAFENDAISIKELMESK